jgi:hypothetical protein
LILNIYTSKGFNSSLVGPWICCGYIINEESKDDEVALKTLMPDLYYPIKNINKIKFLINKDNISIVSIPSEEINFLGNYCVQAAYKKLIAFATSYLEQGENLIINKIEVPSTWYEKVTASYAIFIRNHYLLRMSLEGISYLSLETKIELHMEKMLRFKHLPPKYLLDKSINLFRNVYPRPSWFTKEIDSIKIIKRNHELN